VFRYRAHIWNAWREIAVPLTLKNMKRFLTVPGVLLACATILPATAQANDASNCEYFAQFVMTLAQAHDAGKSRAETEQWARDKAKADHLDRNTANLFVGEATWMYYDKPKYHGSQSQIHTDAYAACINNDLP
jgi:hypothetical protein